ncbi:MAG: tetratricopeptide repeat protein [Sphingobacteriales bacterium]|nr:tetratricopeptide repeat protein [Sphingobacteriales bacterium]
MARKKFNLVLILFALLLHGTISHVNAQEECDSLKLIENLDKSKALFSSDPEKSIKQTNFFLEKARSCNFRRVCAIALKNIGLAHYNQGDYISALDYWNKSLDIFTEINDLAGVANIQNNFGTIYFNQGDDVNALDYYLKALKTAETIKDTLRIVTTCINIGGVYSNKSGTKNKSVEFYLRALPLSELIKDNEAIGTVCVNIGEYYLEKALLDTALYYFNKSLIAFEGSEHVPYTLINIGKVYLKRGDFDSAIRFQTEALNLATELDSKNDVALSLIGLAESLEAKGDFQKALEYYTKARKISMEIGANYQLKSSYQGLSKINAALGDYKNAYENQLLLMAIKDTIFTLDAEKKIGTLQFSFDLYKKEQDLLEKQEQIRRQKLVRNGFIGGFAVVLLFAGVFLSQRNRISKEKKRSEELLLNILPEETAEELKATGQAKAKSFESVSVMFTDFKNFTQASELLSAEQLVEEINRCYSAFDTIITRYGLHHATDIVAAALELQAFIEENKRLRISENLPFFELRLGIHTGPVVAGVVGSKKFAYDIWGDTVNTASRMESSGAVGRVNISATTYELIKHRFRCTPRGKIEAKNKGEIEMFFVEGPAA